MPELQAMGVILIPGLLINYITDASVLCDLENNWWIHIEWKQKQMFNNSSTHLILLVNN